MTIMTTKKINKNTFDYELKNIIINGNKLITDVNNIDYIDDIWIEDIKNKLLIKNIFDYLFFIRI